MKKLTYLLIAVLTVLLPPAASRAETALPGQWRVHNTFDQYFSTAVDTPQRFYLLALGQRRSDSHGDVWKKVNGQLFVLDKEHGEITGYNAANYLNGDVVIDMAYNAAKRYLLIVYDDYTIDLLYDDDTVYNIPGLASANLSTSKDISNIVFDADRDLAWVATDFGYMVIDDKRRVIAESRIYNTRLNSVARVGDRLLAANDDGLYTSPLDDRHTSLDSFTPVEGAAAAVRAIFPLSASTFAALMPDGIYLGRYPEGSDMPVLERISTEKPEAWCENRDGYLLRRKEAAMQLTRQGSMTTFYIDKVGSQDNAFGSWNAENFYLPVSRTGIRRFDYLGSYRWQEGDTYLVNAPQPFAVFGFDYCPGFGMLAGNGTFNRTYSSLTINYPSLVSGYKDGTWSHYGRTATSSGRMAAYMTETAGPVSDPVQPQYIWLGSRRSGLLRVDLEDNTVDMYAYPSHPCSGEQGFHPVFPLSIHWTEVCMVSPPSFDADGNLWCAFNTASAAEGESPVYCWSAADRRAGNVSAFRKVPVARYEQQYNGLMCLATKATRGMLVFGPNNHYAGSMYVLYHGGTPFDTSDDQLWSFSSFVDQDGTSVPYTFFNTFYEDPSTGYIWVGTDTGLFYFDPAEVRRTAAGSSTLNVRRVKVARNDGTNQADYLLNGYDVQAIAGDGASRKWFGTLGSGVTVTSPDGGTILEQLGTSNSRLPADNVYSLGFDPTGNAVWIGTSAQTATYFCDATAPAQDYKNVLASPNPVRPEYHGPVTISGLMEGSLVKIADASGTVVRELGLSNGGMALWDLADSQGREVSAGVYYILTSTSSESVPTAGNSSKILVVR